MADRIDREKEEQTVSSKGSASSKYGKLLFKVETDRKRIGLEILIRLGASAFAVFLMWYQGNTSLMLPTAAVLAILCAWPLLHMGDKMDLYQNGIVYQGQLFRVGPQTRVTWENRRGFFLPITWLNVSNCPDRINVSFMKDAEKLFNRAYSNAIFERGE